MTEPAATVTLRLGTGVAVRAMLDARAGADRPKVLLLHGNPGSLADWQALGQQLSTFADVAAIDLPGFGGSPRPDSSPADVRLERLAEHALALADVLEWDQPIHLVGHSHGAGVAQVAAARWPHRVAGLALLASLGTPAHGSYRLLALPGAALVARATGWLLRSPRRASVGRQILSRVLQDIYSPEPVPRDRIERELALLSHRPEILVSMVHAALGEPCELLARSASGIQCPTLFLHGAEDALVPWQHARRVHDLIIRAGGSSRWHLIEGAGHMLIDYQAAEVAAAVHDFVEGGRPAT